MSDSTEVVECLFRPECETKNEERWAAYKEDRRQQAIFNKRMGAEKDRLVHEIGDLRVMIVQGRDHTEQVAMMFGELQRGTQAYMEKNTQALDGIILEMRNTRLSNEAAHSNIMDIVMHGNSVAFRSVDEAHMAAAVAKEASQSASKASMNLSTMTKAALASWAVAVGAIGAASFGLVTQYLVPWLHRLVDALAGGKTP